MDDDVAVVRFQKWLMDEVTVTASMGVDLK